MQAKLVIVGWVFLAVMTGLMLTATHSQITHKTANINQTKEEISDLQNANERLKLEIDRLKSLDRIEQIATTELGMIQPGINDIEYIAYEKDPEHEEMSAEAAPVEENAAIVKVESGQKMHPAILAVSKMIANYVFDMRRSGEKL